MRRSLLVASTSIAAIACASLAFAQSSTEEYSYDSLGRLVKVVTSGGQNDGQTQSICYDEADNRTQYVANASAGATECTSTPTPGPTPTPSPSPSPTPTPTPPPSNSPPSTTPDLAGGSCLSTTFVNLTANDSDAEGNYPLALTGISKNSGQASATLFSSSTVQIDFGSTSFDLSEFTYTVEDSLGASSTGVLIATTNNCGGGGIPQ